MDRLQKKCAIASAGFHLSLALTFLFGSAFFSADKERSDLQMVDIIPSRIIDAPFVGGGTPNVKPPPPTEQQKPPTPIQESKPTPPPPVRREEPAKEEPKQVNRDRDAIEDKE